MEQFQDAEPLAAVRDRDEHPVAGGGHLATGEGDPRDRPTHDGAHLVPEVGVGAQGTQGVQRVVGHQEPGRARSDDPSNHLDDVHEVTGRGRRGGVEQGDERGTDVVHAGRPRSNSHDRSSGRERPG
jgi:hypothetical protein